MPTVTPPTSRALFTAFLSVGISGFGGVLPYARRQLVEVKRWITDAEMTELLSLAQLLPGPNIVNVAIMLGTRFRGAAGAAAGVLGLTLVPLALFLALGAIYQQFAEVPWLKGAFAGVGAAAAGLVLSVGIRFAHALEPRAWVIALGAAGFLAIVFAHLPLPLVVLVLAPLGVLIAWRRAT
ncbi:MAG: chromate transporter [Burkholderiales bacterium]